MAQTQIYGIMQIQDLSIPLSKLVSPFISATTGNWDITAGNLDATITGIPDPVNDWDVVNKHYVDSLFASNLSWKAPVRVLADSNVDINNPPSSIDGVTLNNGDRIALFNQTTASEDGVYIYNGTGNALTRADDWQTGVGAANWTFWVKEGTQYADTQWTVINDSGSDVIGTDDLQIIQIAGQGLYTFQNGLTKTGNTVEWGGSLLHDTDIDLHGSKARFYDGTGSGIFEVDIPDSSGLHDIFTVDSSKILSTVDLTGGNKYQFALDKGNGINISYEDSSGNIMGFQITDTNGIEIGDKPLLKGMFYSGDYHTNWTDRSIVDKQYVDTYDKTTVRVRATGNVDLTNTPSTIDDVALEVGDLVLLDQQTTTTEDGIYVVTAVSAGTATLERATYFETGVNIKGLSIFVTEGTQNGQSQFIVSNTGTAVIGTDDITVKAIGGAAAGLTYQNLLTQSGNAVEFGGNLLHDTLANLNGYSLTFTSNSGAFEVDISGAGVTDTLYINEYEATLKAEHSDTSKYYVSVFDSGAYFGYADSSENYTGFEFSGSQMVMRDNINSKGLVYADDYHTNWDSDRFLIDKGYSDAYNGIIKVRLLSTDNIDLTNSPDTIDGVTLAVGDLVALVGQTTVTEDGIYVVTAVDTTAHTSTLARATYFEAGKSIKGYLIAVSEGTEHGNTVYLVDNDDNAVLGTNDITVTTVGGASTALTFENALTYNAGVVHWGGTLVENTTVDGDNGNYSVNFHDISGMTIYNTNNYGLTFSSFWRTQFANTTFVQGNTNIQVYYDDGSGNWRQIRIDDTQILIEDSVSTFGMKYAADYYANGHLDDRWIPDWGAVKSLVNDATSRTYNEIHEITSDTTTITLNGATAGDGKSVSNVTIYVNGVRQTEGSSYDYTITDADAGQITFTYTLIGGKTVVVVDYNYI